jgi:hypothetical protein
MGEFIRWYFQDRPSCCFAAPSEDENTDSRIYVSRYPKEDEK